MTHSTNDDELALEVINSLMKERDDVKRRFRARTRDMFSMAYFSGLKYMLAFVYSKAGEAVIKTLFQKGAIEEKINDDERAYALYAVAVLRYLKEAETIDVVELDALLRRIESEEPLISAKLFTYLNWLKIFAEAKIEAE
jgi:CRISPR type III-B/RAMP module-associated protein Cmr5